MRAKLHGYKSSVFAVRGRSREQQTPEETARRLWLGAVSPHSALALSPCPTVVQQFAALRRLARRGLCVFRSPVALPLIAFMAVTAILLGSAIGAGYREGMIGQRVWGRWDSGHYLWLASEGPVLYHCPAGLCGNTGWFRAYPLAVRFLSSVSGLAPDVSAVLLSHVFTLAGLLMVWNYLLGGAQTPKNVACLALAAVFPGHIYFHAIFPLSMCTSAICLSAYWLVRNRFALAGIAGAIAAFSYPTGILWAGAVGIWYLLAKDMPFCKRIWQASVVIALVCLGYGGVALYDWWAIGKWDAYWAVAATYDLELQNPGEYLINQLASSWPPHLPVRIQLAYVSVLIGLIVVKTSWRSVRKWLRWNPPRESVSRLDLLLGLHAVIAFSAPLFIGQISHSWRGLGVLLPSVVLVRHLPTSVITAIVVIALMLSPSMALAFFSGQIV